MPKQSPAWCAYLQLRWKRLERDCRAAKDAARNDDTGLLHNVSSLVDQIRRASRSVSTNIAKAWRKQRYKAAFIAKPGDAETEACETQVWMNFSRRCEYFDGTDVD